MSPHVHSPVHKPGQVTGVTTGAGSQLRWEHGVSKRTLTPLAPCPVNLSPVNVLSSWQRGRLQAGSVCLLSIQAPPDVVLLDVSEGQGSGAPGLHRSLLPRLPEPPCPVPLLTRYSTSASACPTGISHPPLVPLARILEYFGTAPSFEPAVLVLLILASSQPCSASEDQKAVPGPRAVPEQSPSSAGLWGFGFAGAQLVSASQQSSRNCFNFFVCLFSSSVSHMSFNALCQPVHEILLLVGVWFL